MSRRQRRAIEYGFRKLNSLSGCGIVRILQPRQNRGRTASERGVAFETKRDGEGYFLLDRGGAVAAERSPRSAIWYSVG
jgi:hypothetical protein